MHYPQGTGDNPQGEHQIPLGTKANPQGTESNPQGEEGFPHGTGGCPQGENEKYRGDLLRSLSNFLKVGVKNKRLKVCRLQIGANIARITNPRQRGFSNLIHMGLDISSDRLPLNPSKAQTINAPTISFIKLEKLVFTFLVI